MQLSVPLDMMACLMSAAQSVYRMGACACVCTLCWLLAPSRLHLCDQRSSLLAAACRSLCTAKDYSVENGVKAGAGDLGADFFFPIWLYATLSWPARCAWTSFSLCLCPGSSLCTRGCPTFIVGSS